MFRVNFYIIDNEFNQEYDYEGYFEDYAELGKFVCENAEVGNILHILEVEKTDLTPDEVF